jgi:hypothetical protein
MQDSYIGFVLVNGRNKIVQYRSVIIEFGKKDTSCNCEQQVFLKTGTSPTLKIDTWNHVKISSIGKHTTIWLDGAKVVDMDDPSYSKTADMSGGYIGLYKEDASSAFDKVTVTPQ